VAYRKTDWEINGYKLEFNNLPNTMFTTQSFRFGLTHTHTLKKLSRVLFVNFFFRIRRYTCSGFERWRQRWRGKWHHLHYSGPERSTSHSPTTIILVITLPILLPYKGFEHVKTAATIVVWAWTKYLRCFCNILIFNSCFLFVAFYFIALFVWISAL